MRAWVVGTPAPIDAGPLHRIERPLPEPAPRSDPRRRAVLRRCRTDLHLAEGDLPQRRRDVTPGHEVVGLVAATGAGVTRFRLGDRVGVPWLVGTDGTCRFCPRGDENLRTTPSFTGWDVDDGYAAACLADERFAHRLPDGLSDEQAAPLLYAGIIGYRAMRCADVPPGGQLGI